MERVRAVLGLGALGMAAAVAAGMVCMPAVSVAGGVKPAGCSLMAVGNGQGTITGKQYMRISLNLVGQAVHPPYTYDAEVKLLNPKVEICSASIEGLETHEDGKLVGWSSPVKIGRKGGVSSQVTLPVNVAASAVQVHARLLSARPHPKHHHRPVPHHSGHGACTLFSAWSSEAGPAGNTKALSVTLRTIGKTIQGQPQTVQAVVHLNNPRAEICHATIGGTERTFVGHQETSHQLRSFPVTISRNGGASPKITLPANIYGLFARVTGRLA